MTTRQYDKYRETQATKEDGGYPAWRSEREAVFARAAEGEQIIAVLPSHGGLEPFLRAAFLFADGAEIVHHERLTIWPATGGRLWAVPVSIDPSRLEGSAADVVFLDGAYLAAPPRLRSVAARRAEFCNDRKNNL